MKVVKLAKHNGITFGMEKQEKVDWIDRLILLLFIGAGFGGWAFLFYTFAKTAQELAMYLAWR